MNREMKCRAWHKDEGKFLEVNKLYICDGAVMCVQDINEYEQEIDPPLDVNDKNLALVWYTGLKDKNGVEIYEGDIVQIKDHAFQRKEGSLSGIHIDGNYVVGYTDRMELVCGNWLLWNQRPYITVIGNIYENPELSPENPGSLREEPTC